MKRAPVSSLVIYFSTFVALMLLLVITVAAAYIDLGRFNLPIALSISVTKTLLIILFFMHVREGTRLTWTVAAVGFFWLMILLCLAMTDYATRHWGVQAIPF
jgi:cytochrome c oxidase subunit 4